MIDPDNQYKSDMSPDDLKRALIEAKKQEAIGQLTGGVAHDFNNLLAIVMASGSLLRTLPDDKSLVQGCVDDIMSAALKMKNLTKYLISYSRREAASREKLNLTELVRETGRIVRRPLPRTIKYIESLGEETRYVFADQGKIMQALLDICLNAREAVGDSGEIIVNIKNETLDSSPENALAAIEPGAFYVVSVKDTGHGIPKNIIGDIFQPFFTTKPSRAGLGLSNALDIAVSHSGTIIANSEHGHGAEFVVLLPAI